MAQGYPLNIGAWTGQTGDPTDLDESSPFAPGQLGTVLVMKHTALFDPGTPRVFQFVLRDSADATTLETNGGAAFVVDPTLYKVTQDESAQLGGTGAGNVVGVFFKNKPAAGNVGVIQVAGDGPVRILNATTPAIGDVLTPSTTDGQSQATADVGTVTEKVFGTVISLKNAGSIGTHVVKANINPLVRMGW